MKRTQWLIARTGQRLDHVALTLLFLLGLWLIIHFMGTLPRIEAVTSEADDLLRLQTQLAQVSRVTDPANANSHVKSNDKQLPDRKAISSELALLHELAGKAGLRLDQADYDLQKEGSSYWRYRMESEGEFSYPALRQFLKNAFTRLPNLALDNLDIERDTINNGQPRIKLSLSLYYVESVKGAAP